MTFKLKHVIQVKISKKDLANMLETCHRAGCAKVLKSLNVPLDITFASQMFTPHLPRNLPSRIVCSSNSMWVPTTLPANKKGHQPVFMKYNDEILYTSLAIFAWHFSHLLVICVSPSPSLVHGTLQVAPTLVPGLCRLFLHFLDFFSDVSTWKSAIFFIVRFDSENTGRKTWWYLSQQKQTIFWKHLQKINWQMDSEFHPTLAKSMLLAPVEEDVPCKTICSHKAKALALAELFRIWKK